VRAAALFVLLAPALAAADDNDPCANTVDDPVSTPVRDVMLDTQRAACVRQDLSAGVLAHALIDTPGFYGTLGGDLALGGRLVLHTHYELNAQVRLVDVAFVQNAVTKTTHAGAGPITIGAVAERAIGSGARGALVAQLELPYTRDNMETVHVSGQLTAVVTGRLADAWLLHARLGAVAMAASSLGGDTDRIALRAGADIVWQLRTSISLQAGAEASAGWYHGFDHLLLRAAVHWRMADRWRLLAGLGAPTFGDERTNAVLDIGIARD